MTETSVFHFHNDLGVPVLEIGAQHFMCIGALPPFGHPHVFLDMGSDHEIVRPCCSTPDPKLDPFEARPPECALREATAA